MTFLDSLNPQQREAVEHTEGPLAIVAGAGSGKTRVVVSRITWLILKHGVRPESILAVTFTNKAAGEMRERVGRLLDENGCVGGATPLVSTFHSFCVRLLRRYGKRFAEVREGFAPNFSIFDKSDQLAVVKAAFRTVGAVGDLKPRKVLDKISRAKSLGRPGAAVSLRGKDAAETGILNSIYKLYRDDLRASNALDFDDLLIEAIRLLDQLPEIREALQDRYRYLLVDEFQDTNRHQYEIVRLLAGSRRNVCVVGDEDQAIYSWRGANIGNILGFEMDFPSTRSIRLEQNYRSTSSILNAAAAVIERNSQRKGKRLWTDGPKGDLPVLLRSPDGLAEARAVVHEIGRLLNRDPKMRVGLLYRTNAQSRVFEEALRRNGRDYVLVGGVSFYERAEVKDMLAYLRAAVFPEHTVSLRRILNVPARGIGKTTLGRLQDLASREGLSLWQAIEESVDRQLVAPRARSALDRFRRLMARLRDTIAGRDLDFALAWIFDRTGYRQMLESDDSAESGSRLENVRELIVAARESVGRRETVEDFLDHAALVADSDGIDQAASILLLTLHNAKGLEFEAVAIVGMEETLLPHLRSIRAGDDAVEEERRLCYVGMTRARRHLILSHADRRSLYPGKPLDEMPPSRFLEEIPEHLRNARSSWGRASTSGWTSSWNRPPTRPDPKIPRAGSVPPASMKTHDSVSAVAGFFKDRGISIEAPPVPAAPAAPPIRSGPVRGRPGGDAPKLGQALKRLRTQGPFARGTRVRHEKFGVGVVRRRIGEGPRAKLTVYFSEYGLKKLVAGHPKLQEL